MATATNTETAGKIVWGCPSATILRTSTAALDPAALLAALVAAWPDQRPELQAWGVGGPLDPADRSGVFTVVLGGIAIDCLAIAAPAPGLDGVIQTSRMKRDELPALRKQVSHVLCSTTAGPEHGIDATAQLFRLALAFEGQGALGVIHTSAHQCFLLAHLRAHLTAEALAHITGGAFQMVWCNAIPFHGTGGSWMTSKGFAVAGVPDVTIWARNAAELDAAGKFLPNFFTYLKGGARLGHGETIQMTGGGSYRIGPVTEFPEFLNGRGETLALVPVGGAMAKSGGISMGLLLMTVITVIIPYLLFTSRARPGTLGMALFGLVWLVAAYITVVGFRRATAGNG